VVGFKLSLKVTFNSTSVPSSGNLFILRLFKNSEMATEKSEISTD
jgi:hypothetical protein